MNAEKLKEVHVRLEALDDRLGHRIRARGGPARATLEQIEDKQKALAEYVSELRDLVHEFLLAFATKKPPSG